MSPGQRVLEIGFGWGSLSLLLAKHFGARVTGITLSEQQLSLATQRVKDAGLEHLIDFHLVDYRVHQPANGVAYDRIVSCEMLEAVGHEYMPDYFRHCGRLLAPGGVLVVQVITTPEGRYDAYRRSTDFIKEYIFPGCCCPSLAAVLAAAGAGGGFTLAASEEIGTHYAPTLLRWREAFMANAGPLKALGFNDAFIRCWDYYFQYTVRARKMDIAPCARLLTRVVARHADLALTRYPFFLPAGRRLRHANAGRRAAGAHAAGQCCHSGKRALPRRAGGHAAQALVVSAGGRNTRSVHVDRGPAGSIDLVFFYPQILLSCAARACLATRPTRDMLGRGQVGAGRDMRIAPAAYGGTCLTSVTASA